MRNPMATAMSISWKTPRMEITQIDAYSRREWRQSGYESTTPSMKLSRVGKKERKEWVRKVYMSVWYKKNAAKQWSKGVRERERAHNRSPKEESGGNEEVRHPLLDETENDGVLLGQLEGLGRLEVLGQLFGRGFEWMTITWGQKERKRDENHTQSCLLKRHQKERVATTREWTIHNSLNDEAVKLWNADHENKK